MRDLKEIVLHYLVAALWTNELDEYSAVCDIDQNTRKKATEVCKDFVGKAGNLLTEDWTDEQIGHDIWLTRGGHGAGFWDRDLPNADELSDIASENEFHGMVYVENETVFIDE